MKTMPARIAVTIISFLVLVLVLQGCTPFGTVQGISPAQAVVQRGQWVDFTISGKGDCSKLRIDWGDGNIEEQHFNFDVNPSQIWAHNYEGWGGIKTATAEGVSGCVGKVQTAIDVQPHIYRLAFMAGGPVTEPQTTPGCYIDPNMPTVHQNSTVTITTNPNARIDFGCFAGTCVYDIDGQPNTSAPSDYPFPGYRQYSLILRLGSQVEQGGDNVTFTASQNANMEICLNDNDPSGNSGAWGIFVDVAE